MAKTEMSQTEIMSPKVDVAFKMLFGDKRNAEILIAFLEAVLCKKIKSVVLLDSVLKPRNKQDKKGILDVRAELDCGDIVNIEMQVKNVPEMRHRVSFYNSAMLVEQLGKGGKYLDIKPAISIIVVKDTLIHESQKCHNVFLMRETDEGFAFNSLQEIHVLDLSRVEREEDKTLANWLEFIKSEKEEDFMAVAQKDRVINLAFGQLKILSADKQRRMLYEARLKEQRDIWSFQDAARQEGRQEGRDEIFEYLAKGYSIEDARKKFLVR